MMYAGLPEKTGRFARRGNLPSTLALALPGASQIRRLKERAPFSSRMQLCSLRLKTLFPAIQRTSS